LEFVSLAIESESSLEKKASLHILKLQHENMLNKREIKDMTNGVFQKVR